MINIEIEQGEPPALDAYGAGLENARKVRHIYTKNTIAVFVNSIKYKKDSYTKGFIEGLTETTPMQRVKDDT